MGAWFSQSWCMKVHNLLLNETCKKQEKQSLYKMTIEFTAGSQL